MLDEKLYKETYSALHASEDTLQEVLKRTEQKPKREWRSFRSIVAIAAVIAVTFSACTAVGTLSGKLGGWNHKTLPVFVKWRGYNYPEQLGDYVAEKAYHIDVTPVEASEARAYVDPDYQWISVEYYAEGEKYLSGASVKLHAYFGKLDNELWAHCFSYDIETKTPRPYEPDDNVDVIARMEYEYEYEGCTIYLAEMTTRDTELAGEEYASRESSSIEATWVDEEAGLCVVLSSDSEEIEKEELLEYVKEFIEVSRGS